MDRVDVYVGVTGGGQERNSVLKIQDQLQQRARDLQERQRDFPRRKAPASILLNSPLLIGCSTS